MLLLKVNVLQDALTEATDWSCGCTKDPAEYKQTWWWNCDVKKSASERRKLRNN